MKDFIVIFISIYLIALSVSANWQNIGTPSNPMSDDMQNAGYIMQALFGTEQQLQDKDPWGNVTGCSTGGGVFDRLNYITYKLGGRVNC